MLSPTEIVEFKDFSRLLSDFPVLFKTDSIFKGFSIKPSKFKDFSRKPFKFKDFSSTFQASASPVKLELIHLTYMYWLAFDKRNLTLSRKDCPISLRCGQTSIHTSSWDRNF